MIQDLVVREAHDNDAEQVKHLLGQLGYESCTLELRHRIKRLGKSSDDCLLVAVRGSRIVGLAALHVWPLFSTVGCCGRISTLVVSEESRQAGVGRALLHAAENSARKMGCTQMEVTSRSVRAGAHAFYRHLGYTHVASRRFKKWFDRPTPWRPHRDAISAQMLR